MKPVTKEQVLAAYEKALDCRVIQATGMETQEQFENRMDAISNFNTLELQFTSQSAGPYR
jgi:hypothetical protein